DRLSTRRLEVPGGHEPLPVAAAPRREQAQDPLGQPAPPVRAVVELDMRIGFVGVGHIGEPMAAQLLAAGHELIVHDARPDAARRDGARDPLAAGARWATSPADVATRADVVATCLPGPAEMEQVCLGPRGLAEGIRPGALYIDHTTNSPLPVTRVHRALGARGVDMLDAPVSGGMEGARTRDLLLMARA